MIRVSVGAGDLSDGYLRRITQLGVDCVDFGDARAMPGVEEKGYPDVKQLVKINKKVRAWGLDVNRVTLPDITEGFFRDETTADSELDKAARSLSVFGDAGFKLASQRFEGSNFNHLITFYPSIHRGGYVGSGKSVWLTGESPPEFTREERESARTGAGGRMAYWPRFGYHEPPSRDDLDDWWSHFCRVFDRLVPIAEQYDMRLGIHPSDVPLPDTPFGSLGFHRITDAFPSRNVGYVYCCGTRAEAGGLPLVLDEIHNYGRKDRIFMVHFRNVRGSLATSGGYEEVLMDDGDMNMFKILVELKKVGFHGCLSPDHYFPIEGDTSGREQGLAYSVGYMKGLLAALATS